MKPNALRFMLAAALAMAGAAAAQIEPPPGWENPEECVDPDTYNGEHGPDECELFWVPNECHCIYSCDLYGSVSKWPCE